MSARPTDTCLHCKKPIVQNRQGIWGARRYDDPHPWYCDRNPKKDRRHEIAE